MWLSCFIFFYRIYNLRAKECWQNLRQRVIGWRDWVSTVRGHGYWQVFTVVWSSYGITGWELWLTDSTSMMDQYVASISTTPSHFLSPEVWYDTMSIEFVLCVCASLTFPAWIWWIYSLWLIWILLEILFVLHYFHGLI